MATSYKDSALGIAPPSDLVNHVVITISWGLIVSGQIIFTSAILNEYYSYLILVLQAACY